MTRGASAVQVVPWDTINLQRPFFDKGPEPVAARLLDFAMLRGAWAGSVASGGNWHDISGHGNHLSYQGDPVFNYVGLVPFWYLDGTGDYFSITDAASGNDYDILGTEAYVAAAVRGLTVMGWFYPEETGTVENLITKWGGAGNRAYRLLLLNTDQFDMRFSDDGTNLDFVSSAVVSMNAWYFVCGRVRPAAFVDVFVGSPVGLVETNQATARASIFNSATDLNIGAEAGGTNPFQGRVAFCSVCAAALSNTQISVFYHMTKRPFGH